jgi:CheY-like chemotaxis protein
MVWQTDVPESFVEEVKQALEHIYDNVFLQKHSFATRLDAHRTRGETPGQAIRRRLIEAIEALNPGNEFFFRSPQARLYNLLHLHYIEVMTVQEAAHELGISVRQAYRDLRRAQQSVAELLWRELQSPHTPAQTISYALPDRDANTPLNAAELSSAQAEFGRLADELGSVRFDMLIRAALRPVEQLSKQQHIHIMVEYPEPAIILSTNSVLAQQLLVAVLSYSIQQALSGPLHVTISQQSPQVITLTYTPMPNAGLIFEKPMIKQLTQLLGWKLIETTSTDEMRRIEIHTTNPNPIILIIDDNEGLVDLLDRYLSGHAYQVLSANRGMDGLNLAQKTLPDAIVLDVMMPEMDGWELLQRLKAQPQTRHIPVIICSVFNDPELAYSLGASLFVPKPVTRDDILAALRELKIE